MADADEKHEKAGPGTHSVDVEHSSSYLTDEPLSPPGMESTHRPNDESK